MKGKPLTWEGHQTAGHTLVTIHQQLLEMLIDIGNRYGTSSKVCRIQRTMDAISNLRSELDTECLMSFLREIRRSSPVYYCAATAGRDNTNLVVQVTEQV